MLAADPATINLRNPPAGRDAATFSMATAGRASKGGDAIAQKYPGRNKMKAINKSAAVSQARLRARNHPMVAAANTSMAIKALAREQKVPAGTAAYRILVRALRRRS